MLDVVHSHACKNTSDGLNMFDGTGKIKRLPPAVKKIDLLTSSAENVFFPK